MSKREGWRTILDAEMQRWSAMSCDELISQLSNLQAYQVNVGSSSYNVEVEMLENTNKYVHVMVAVDDGSLPASILPLTKSFICPKSGAGVAPGTTTEQQEAS
jgi:hypothetical protein